MIAQPLFSIELESHQDFNVELLYKKLNNLVSEKILQTFKKKEIKLDKNVDPVIEKENERWAVKGKGNKWYQIVKTKTGFDVYEGFSRHYTSTVIPTLISQKPEKHDNLLIDLYKEVCSNWKMLTDVRFKLLGFVPAVSIVAWGQLLSSDTLKTIPGAFAGIVIATLGLLITIAIRIYDKRNDTLYDDLISRGRKIEEELGIDTGIFRGRRNPPKWWIKHSIPVNIIYGTAITGWLSIGLWFALIAAKVFTNVIFFQ